MEKAKVLLVDDEGEFLQSLVKVLGRRGLDVEGVTSGQEALERMEKTPFDVVVLDLMMPGMDGMETLKRIKSAWPQTEVILLTAVGSVDMGLQGMSAGAFDYVLKPMDVDELVEKIRQAHERSWLQLEASLGWACSEDQGVSRSQGGDAMGRATRVLLIDDEELYAESLAKVLKRRGMEVSTARDGASGIAWLESNQADVVVLDLKMPGMDGIATMEGIRHRDASTPIILLTGHIDLERVTRALQGGVGDILLKPCPVDSLAAAIENAKERHLAAQALKEKGAE